MGCCDSRFILLLPEGEGARRADEGFSIINSTDSINFARSLRRNQTGPEERLWAELRGRRLDGYKFRRQFPIGGYVVDFVCMERRLIVEIDGGSHVERKAYDDKRTKDLEALGFVVMRLWNEDVTDDIVASLDAIHKALKSSA